MKKTFTLILLILITVLVSGCINLFANNVNTKHDSVTTSINNNNESRIENESFKVIEENVLGEYRYYSPNKQNYISNVYNGMQEAGLIIIKTYLNDKILLDTDNELFWGQYRTPTVGWLDNTRALVNGRYILNINDNSKKPIDFSNIISEGLNIYNYTLNNDKTKIAYIIVGNYNELVYIYNISDNTWKKVYETQFKTTDDTIYYGLSWDYQNNLYFGTADFIAQDPEYSTTQNNIQYNIYIYKDNDKTITLFRNNYEIVTSSPNYKYLVIYSRINKTYEIVEINSGQIQFTFPKSSFCWLNNDNIIVYLKSKSEISIYSILEKGEIKQIDLSKLTDKGFSIWQINYFDQLVFYACKTNIHYPSKYIIYKVIF